MIVFTILSICLALATGYQQNPNIRLEQPRDMRSFYYETEFIGNENPVQDATDEDPLSDAFIEKINRLQNTWKV